MQQSARDHTGAVYLNGDWLIEAGKLEAVLKPAGKTALWFGQVDKANTTIWAQFPGVNPNEQAVEINVRQTVFYPEKTGINYITVRGFTLRTPPRTGRRPPPEQIGVIGTHWSKGWIIENNSSATRPAPASRWASTATNSTTRPPNSAEGYVKTVERAP